MSLIHFHILLISVSIVFGIGFGFWEMHHAAETKCMVEGWTGIASFAAAGLLSAYLFWFLRRLRNRSSRGGP